MHSYESIFWLILTVALEARGEPPLGQKHVAKVILNRAAESNQSISKIVLEKNQFSCYNDGITNAIGTLKFELPHIPKVTKQVIAAIDEWKDGHRLKGATHYYAYKRVSPIWSKKMTVITKTKKHAFLKVKK